MENPIEKIFVNKKSLVIQRQIGRDVNSFIDLVLEMGLLQFVYDYKYSDIDEIGDDEAIKLWEGLAPFLGKVYEKPLKLYYAIHKEEY